MVTSLNARCVSLFVGLLVTCVQMQIVSAQGEFLPVPQITAIFPQGAQAGTTSEVVVFGEHLDGPCNLVCAGGDFEFKAKEDEHGKPVSNTFVVHVPAGIRPGAYDFRLQGKYGLSNPRHFLIGGLPELVVAKSSIDQANPTELQLNTTVNARTVAGSRAWFRLVVADEQLIHLHLEAPDSRVEPIVTVFDPTGAIVLRGRLPSKDFQFLANRVGDYRISVHDLLNRGGDEYAFRISLASEPYRTFELDSMASAVLSREELERIQGSLTDVAGAHAVSRSEFNASELPIERVGLFPSGGQPIRFWFSAKGKEVYWIEVFSHRLGYATDPTLVLERVEKDSQGKDVFQELMEAPDLEHSPSAVGFDLDSRDGRIRFEAPSDGLYRISLRDAFNSSANGPGLPFRLCVRTPTPDFALIAVPDQGPRSRPIPSSVYLVPPTLRRGGVASVRVFGERQDNFQGEIVLSADGLPDGVTCLGATLGPGDECASLTFFASENAQPWAGPVRIQGIASVDGSTVVRVAQAGTPVWNLKDTRQDRFQTRRMDSMGLAVVPEDAPMSLEPTKDFIEAHANDKITVQLKVTRRGGYDQIVSVRPFVLGDQEKSARSDHTIPKDATEVNFELDLAKFAVSPGEHSFVFHGFADKVQYTKAASDGKTEKPKAMSFSLFSKPIRLRILPDEPK